MHQPCTKQPAVPTSSHENLGKRQEAVCMAVHIKPPENPISQWELNNQQNIGQVIAIYNERGNR